jgi:uncharacterized protein YndB with AHSA1/START domain
MDIFYALAEPTRRKIIEMLIRNSQLSATEIYDHFPVSRPAISQHLQVLRQANLVQVEKRAQQRIYRVNPQAMREVELWAGRNNLIVEREKRSYTMSRVFNAPRERVWKVVTDPKLIPRWWGPRDHTTIVDKMQVRVGGVWRYIQKDPDGNEFAFHGKYKEVLAPERLTYTFEFELMPGHIATETETFEEQPDGRTMIISMTVFDTLEDLEGMLQAGMEGGAVESWDQLEELLAKTRKEK